jgi:hypothetical protein
MEIDEMPSEEEIREMERKIEETSRRIDEISSSIMKKIQIEGTVDMELVRKAIKEIEPMHFYAFFLSITYSEDEIEELIKKIKEREEEILKNFPPEYGFLYKKNPKGFVLFYVSLKALGEDLRQGYVVEEEENGRKVHRFTEQGFVKALIEHHVIYKLYNANRLLRNGYVLIIADEDEILRSLLMRLSREAPETLNDWDILTWNGIERIGYVLLKKSEKLREILEVPEEMFKKAVYIQYAEPIPLSSSMRFFPIYVGFPKEEKDREEFIKETTERVSIIVISRMEKDILGKGGSE